MSIEIEQVEKFYQIIWNRHDKSVILDILADDVRFRGSLGQTKTGHAGFSEYLDMVHDALKNFKCVIALFKFNNNKISDLWVLGDVKFLEQQLVGVSAS